MTDSYVRRGLYGQIRACTGLLEQERAFSYGIRDLFAQPMTLRLDKPRKTMILKLGKGEEIFKVQGATVGVRLLGLGEHDGGVAIQVPKDLFLEIRKTRRSLPQGWGIVK